jgi:hypothetical protein
MADLQELEQGQGVEQEVSNETVQDSTAPEPATRQPAKVNLDELPEFRQFKSATDKRIAEMERRYQAQLAAAQQQQEQLRQQQLASMEPEDRVAYELAEERRLRAAAEQRAQAYEVEQAKRAALQGIADKAKVPVDVLMDATSPDHAWELAWDYREQEAAKAAKETPEAKAARQQKREANKVDLGIGKPPPSPDDWESIDKLYRDGKIDTREYFNRTIALKK